MATALSLFCWLRTASSTRAASSGVPPYRATTTGT